MSQEELEKRVRDSGSLVERLDKCHEMIGKMCKEGRPPKMTIPVQWHDEDFFISVTLQDAIRAQHGVHPTLLESPQNYETWLRSEFERMGFEFKPQSG